MQFNVYNRLLFAGIIGIVMFAGGCTSTQTLINRGDYDKAIQKTVKKLQKNRENEKNIDYLDRAFHKVNERDLERIEFLKKEGTPDNAVKIYELYQDIKARQVLIYPLTPLKKRGREVQFDFIDVDHELIESKKEAAEYLYEHAMELLEGDKYDARRAYAEFIKLDEMYRDYKDTDRRIQEAYDKGLNYVQFQIDNVSYNLVPKEFTDELSKLDFNRVEGGWYTIATAKLDNPDYILNIRLNVVDVGPEREKQREYTETKEIEDGFKYATDDQGNYIKDSLGNNIKVPIIKEISCTVTEIEQSKQATFRGKLEIIERNGSTWRTVKSDDLTVNARFENISATASGNTKALKTETADKLKNKPVQFPTDFDMIMDGTSRIQSSIQSFIRNNRRILEG